MDPLGLVVLLALGVVLGVLGGLLGLGGGLFAIPILGLAFGLDEQHAQGTALVMVMPNVAIGLYAYAKRGLMNPKIGWTLAACALPMTIVGARIATRAPSASLRVAFALFIAVIALYTALTTLSRRDPASGEQPVRLPLPWPFATVVGALGGMLSGLFGVGGAIFSIPLVSYMFVVPQAVAQGFGLALVAPGTLAGVATYTLAGDVIWEMGIPLALGGLVAVPLGVRLAHALPEKTLKLAFAALMLASTGALLYRR